MPRCASSLLAVIALSILVACDGILSPRFAPAARIGETRPPLASARLASLEKGTEACARLAKNGVPAVNPGETPLHLITGSPPLSQAVPAIVLIHGWLQDIGVASDYCQAQSHGDLPGENYFASMIQGLRARYPNVPLLTFDYQSYNTWRTNVTPLALQLGPLAQQSRGFVLIAHSMGGMIADGGIEASAPETQSATLGLITLGTPHEATPLASFSTTDGLMYELCQRGIQGSVLPLHGICTPGFISLSVAAPYNAVVSARVPVYAHAGTGGITAGGPIYSALSTILCEETGGINRCPPNDGVVPLYSALLNGWSSPAVQTSTWGLNHSQLAQATGPLFTALAEEIDDFFSRPARVEFVSVPATGTVGVSLPTVSVQVTDALGRPLCNVVGTVSVALVGPNAPLGPAAPYPLVSGRVTIPGITVSTAGVYHLVATTSLPRVHQASASLTIASANTSGPGSAPDARALHFLSLSTSGSLTCGISTRNDAYCWGDYSAVLGQTSAPLPPTRSLPTLVPGGGKYLAVAAGLNSACAVTATHGVACWGWNQWGQLGNGVAEPDRFSTSPVPVPVPGLVQETGGGDHFHCARTSTGDVYCWGIGAGGRLGIGQVGQPVAGGDVIAVAPTHVTGTTKFTQLAIGDTHSCALGVGGIAYCWGLELYGQVGSGLGFGSGLFYRDPRPVATSLRFTSLASGTIFTCGVTTGRAVACWGRGWSGVPAIRNAVPPANLLSAGDGACALDAQGAASCWLETDQAYLGDGSFYAPLGRIYFSPPGSPVLVVGSHRFKSLTGFGGVTCGIRMDDIGFCWGFNRGGALGDGTITNRAAPTQIGVSTPIIFPMISGYSWNMAPVTSQVFSGTINGTGFITSGTQVFFCFAGTANCFQHPAAGVSSTSITVTNVGLGVAGSYEVYVVTATGQSARSVPFMVR